MKQSAKGQVEGCKEEEAKGSGVQNKCLIVGDEAETRRWLTRDDKVCVTLLEGKRRSKRLALCEKAGRES